LHKIEKISAIVLGGACGLMSSVYMLMEARIPSWAILVTCCVTIVPLIIIILAIITSPDDDDRID